MTEDPMSTHRDQVDKKMYQCKDRDRAENNANDLEIGIKNNESAKTN